MGKAKFIMILLFALTLGSGLVAGILVTRLPATVPAPTPPRTPLAQELQLTTEQNRQMRDIWEGVCGKVDECFLRAQDIQKRRDNALFALLTDEQKVRFAKVQTEFADTLSSLKKQREAAFQEAVKRTEQILSEPQKQRYREILQSRLGDGPDTRTPDWIPLPPASMPSTGP